MKRIKKILLALFVGTLPLCVRAQNAATSSDPEVVTFDLEWQFDKKLPIEVKTVLAPNNEAKRVAETGLVTEQIKLPMAKVLEGGKVRLRKSDKAILYLFIKNTGSRTLRFSVAPHSTDPGMASVGFNFHCLCNGHIYEVPPNSIWYRIMALTTKATMDEPSVKLVHQIFEVEPEAKSKKKSRAHSH
jgi:hypothetical protein